MSVCTSATNGFSCEERRTTKSYSKTSKVAELGKGYMRGGHKLLEMENWCRYVHFSRAKKRGLSGYLYGNTGRRLERLFDGMRWARETVFSVAGKRGSYSVRGIQSPTGSADTHFSI